MHTYDVGPWEEDAGRLEGQDDLMHSETSLGYLRPRLRERVNQEESVNAYEELPWWGTLYTVTRSTRLAGEGYPQFIGDKTDRQTDKSSIRVPTLLDPPGLYNKKRHPF